MSRLVHSWKNFFLAAALLIQDWGDNMGIGRKPISHWSQYLKDTGLITAQTVKDLKRLSHYLTSINWELEVDRRFPTWLVLMVEFKEREARKHEVLDEVLRAMASHFALVRSRGYQVTVQFKTYFKSARTIISLSRLQILVTKNHKPRIWFGQNTPQL